MDEQDKISQIGKLEEELAKYKLESDVLREVSDLVGSAADLQAVYNRVADYARELLNAEITLIPIVNEGLGGYTYMASSGAYAQELLGETLPMTVGICGWVFRENKPWWRGALDDLSDDERNRWEKDAGSVILVPLVGKNGFLGGIGCINKIGAEEFTEHDLNMLVLFASNISIAIENARFFHEMKNAREAEGVFRQELVKTNAQLLAANNNLGHLAVHDPLTGLPNRTLIKDRLDQGIKTSQRNDSPLALVVLDLNNFKDVNDTLGHMTGDELLIAIGARFQQTLRNSDALGRLGGDEFAIVLPGAGIKEATQVAIKLSECLTRPINIADHHFAISASMGIALYPEHGSTSALLMKNADIAMYSSKCSCEDYAVYSPTDDSHSTDRLDLLNDLRKAVECGDIKIALQPKVNLKTELTQGFEALARWTHPVHGIIGPDIFVPMVESLGLIKQFSLLILQQSLDECFRLRMAGYDIGIAVNLSTHNLKDPFLAEQIAELMGRYRVKSGTLTIEITETAMMSDAENSLRVLSELESMGIHLSIDDYGTGYSSLSYIKRLPVCELKIDRLFIGEMIADTDNAVIVRSTIDLAHNLGLSVVAEGIENMATYEVLQSLGCDSAQGYEICRPLPPENILEFLESSRWPGQRFKKALAKEELAKVAEII